jgi:hypothetical protein
MLNNKKMFVINALRRASYRWYGRYNALSASKVGRNQYICAMCGEGITHPKKNVQLDHKDPVVPVIGWDSWEGFIDRLFCDTEGYQTLCLVHHRSKSKAENSSRKKPSKKKQKIEDEI